MIQATYRQLIEKISQLSGLTVEEILRRCEAKKAKLSGLISDEGAAQVIAAELGIAFEKEKLKIINMLSGMRKVHVIGKVINMEDIRKYHKGDHDGEIGFFTLADETSNIRTVLWDVNHIALIKDSKITKGSVVEIKNADVRGTTVKELHLGSSSELNVIDAEMENVNTEIKKEITAKISDLKSNERADIRAAILQVFQPAFFYVCPECNMKVSYEGEKALCLRHGTIIPKKRAIISVVIDDGLENMRASIFNETILKLFNAENIEALSDPNFFAEKKAELLGTEWIFSGRARKNALFNKTEFAISDLSQVNVDELLKELSKDAEV